ncbi:ECF-type sigma factor [Crateriforma conspicua]|uniref:RNA polymerase sigma factor SigD n=1 Tax=Crateriforma conspicua TaxID=2527996 RepID=A0A5C6FZU1_9PLAN|nr:RNA polymerase sigma factor SigD [Crateriforma conspicua]
MPAVVDNISFTSLRRALSDTHDITAIIRSVEDGDPDAAAELWSHCFPRLLNYCRGRLPEHMRRVLDEEDVALSAFKSFCLGAAGGAFGDIKGRDELWKLLFCIAGRKAQGYIRHQNRQKRGGGKVAGESIFKSDDDSSVSPGIEQVADQTPCHVSKAHFVSDCETLFDMLDDQKLQMVAILRIEGYSVDEIAARMECSRRSVERRLNLIRRIWQSAFDDADPPESNQRGDG